MSKILFCIECGTVLHTFSVTISEGFLSSGKQDLLYCMNEECSRHSLLSLHGYKSPPSKPPKKVRRIK